MKFSNALLNEAVWQAYQVLRNPRSRQHLTDPGELLQIVMQFHGAPFPYDPVDVLEEFDNFGKSRKNLLIVKHGIRQRWLCFYSGRVRGECCDNCSLDRIIAGGEYTLWNTILVCTSHNSSRQNQRIDDYLEGNHV